MECTKCGSKSGKSKWCSRCKQGWVEANRERSNASKKAWVARRRLLRDQLKAAPCSDCGKQYHPKLMEFDHRTPGSKQLTIGRGGFGTPMTTTEIQKCDLVCVMCHRTRTHLRREPRKSKRNVTHDARRDYVVIAKDGPCAQCGTKYPHWQMDFDHMRDKVVNPSMVSRVLDVGEIHQEISKCRLLCALCHRAKTFGVSPVPS